MLLKADLTSASQIVRLSLPAFAAKIRPGLLPFYGPGTERVIETVYWKAQQHSATVFNVFDGLRRLDTSTPAPYAATPDDVTQHAADLEQARTAVKALFPDWETLFGTVDYCDCPECRSVLSPAAYLVDILHFLDPDDDTWESTKANYEQRLGAPYPTDQKPFDLLDARRPDLKKILLTCENTNVELPYVDVVNEILEQLMLSEAAAAVSIDAYDVGDADSAALIAEPAHLQWEAYVGNGAVKGLRDLVYPLTLPFDLPLEMARAFLQQLGAPLWQVREQLNGLTSLDGSAAGILDGWRDVWLERLGLSPSEVGVLTTQVDWFRLYGYDKEADALTELASAETLARRLGVSYADLVEMTVRTQFVNADPAVVLRVPDSATDFADVTLTPADGAPAKSTIAYVLRKLNAFVRLNQHLGWDIHDLDRVLTGLAGNTAPTSDIYEPTMRNTLVNLAHVVDIGQRLGGALSPEETVLLWSDIPTEGINSYYDRMFLAAGPSGHDPAFDRNAAGKVLTAGGVKLTAHAAALRQAFQIGYDDVTAISQALGLTDVLTIANVSALQRPALLARGLGLTPTQTIALLGLSAAAPFGPLATDEMTSLDQDRAWVGTIAFLDQVQRAADAGADLDQLIGSCTGLPEDAIDPDADPAVLAVLAVPPVPQPDPDPADPTLSQAEQQQAQDAVDADEAKHRGALVAALSYQLGASPATISLLAGTLLTTGAPAAPLLDAGFGDQKAVVASIVRIRRAIAPIVALELSDGELDYLAGLTGALDLDEISNDPAPDAATAQSRFAALQTWLDLVALRKAFGRSERVLAVLQAASAVSTPGAVTPALTQELVDAVVALTGLAPTSVTAVLAELTPPAAGQTAYARFASPTELRRSVETLRCFRRIRVEPAQLAQLAKAEIGQAEAQQLRSSLQASYSRSSWQTLVQPIFDGLRAKQRDALVAHLTSLVDAAGKPKFGATSAQLFECLLLDPAMEPVVLGSRIQMAIASVQTFVQRCFMNLEKALDSGSSTRTWAWMRRYRVWEANREDLPLARRTGWNRSFATTRRICSASSRARCSRATSPATSSRRSCTPICRVSSRSRGWTCWRRTSSHRRRQLGPARDRPYPQLTVQVLQPQHVARDVDAVGPIEVGIDGDHLVLTLWRGRLHLFWLSFFQEAHQPDGASVVHRRSGDRRRRSSPPCRRSS